MRNSIQSRNICKFNYSVHISVVSITSAALKEYYIGDNVLVIIYSTDMHNIKKGLVKQVKSILTFHFSQIYLTTELQLKS